jgi:hypothetical protein
MRSEGTSMEEVAAAMGRLRKQAGVPCSEAASQMSANMARLYPDQNPSTIEWERRCEVSLARSRARRNSPHPWPHGADWQFVLFLLVLSVAALYAAWLLAIDPVIHVG